MAPHASAKAPEGAAKKRESSGAVDPPQAKAAKLDMPGTAAADPPCLEAPDSIGQDTMARIVEWVPLCSYFCLCPCAPAFCMIRVDAYARLTSASCPQHTCQFSAHTAGCALCASGLSEAAWSPLPSLAHHSHDTRRLVCVSGLSEAAFLPLACPRRFGCLLFARGGLAASGLSEAARCVLSFRTGVRFHEGFCVCFCVRWRACVLLRVCLCTWLSVCF